MSMTQRLSDFAFWVADTDLSIFLTDEPWAFPTFETVHVISLCLVFGSIMIVDLRLLGLASTARPAGEVIKATLPMTWIGFAGAATSGAVLFCANPIGYSENFYFLGKLALLALAGANMVFFHLFVQRQLADQHAWMPRISGGISLALWTVIVGFGRWIGFTL